MQIRNKASVVGLHDKGLIKGETPLIMSIFIVCWFIQILDITNEIKQKMM